MKFSELWLREWVNTTLDSEALSNQITMAGLEVDGVEPVSGAFTGVVVGEVMECGQHPNADKLRVTKSERGRRSPAGHRLRCAELPSGSESGRGDCGCRAAG